MPGQGGPRRGWWVVALVLVVVVAIAVAGVLVVNGRSSSAGAVTLEPATAAGTDPFTASVQIGPAVAFPGNVQAITTATRKTFPTNPKTHTIVATGTAPGLYGGSGDTHVCDPQQLVTFLGQHPDKARAWAGVLGVAPNNIATYVGGLTPVILTSDTLVTNHGYYNGRATTLQSVLQAGTAVMVDNTGTPRVKCNCGNPLTPPEPITPTHTSGIAWSGYQPANVVVVNGGPTVVNITVINIFTGDNYTQPVGGQTTPTTATTPAGSSGLADGTYTISMTPDACALDSGALNGQTLTVAGSHATINSSRGGAYTGSIEQNGANFVIVAKVPDGSASFTFSMSVESTGDIDGTYVWSGANPISGASETCRYAYTASRGSSQSTAPTTAPAPAPTTAPAPGGTAGTCSESSIWYGITTSVSANDKPTIGQFNYRCDGAWAFAAYTSLSGKSERVVLHFNPNKLLTGVWEAAPDACANGQVPASLQHDACTG